ncbi:unnamed protein product [Brassicogethes aeneus]|uniref:Uncharacterized protein n=1 Tax=Brassicogethes aeneus TaxID=1431903 RepID=A0A9P0BH01_BRAAE|nr:unnamed protein product [Brassicogethes aeneus]
MESVMDSVETILHKIDSDLYIPKNIRQLLIYQGFDNLEGISLMNDQDICDMECFAQKVLPKLMMKKSSEEKLDIYGIYAENTELFQIPPGHKKLLQSFSEACKIYKASQRKPLKRKKENINGCDKCKCTCKNEKRNKVDKQNLKTQNDALGNISGIDDQLRAKKNIIDHLKRLSQEYVKKLYSSLGKEQNLNTEDIVVNILGEGPTFSFATVRCPIPKCGFEYKVSSSDGRYGKKWILSNFNKHLKTHFKSEMNEQLLRPSKGSTNSSLLNFLEGGGDLEGETRAGTSALYSKLQATPKQSFNHRFNENPRSRHQRNRRMLNTVALHQNQTKLSDFYSVFKNVQMYLERDSTMRQNLLQHSKQYIDQITFTADERTNKSKGLLNILKEHALKNSEVKLHGNRFDEPLKLFGLYIFIIGGRLLYETLYQNLRCSLPSITTINKTLDECQKIKEGQLRFSELKTYLVKRNLPLKVFISEDQTAILRRIQYDPKTNEMTGFLLPLSENTGFPITGKYVVNTLSDIEIALKEGTISNNAYVFMAQPLAEHTPGFCLGIFGTDNRFNYKDVLKRWNHIVNEAGKEGILIEGFSSDGDPKCLKSMRIWSNVGHSNHETKKQDGCECPYESYFKVGDKFCFPREDNKRLGGKRNTTEHPKKLPSSAEIKEVIESAKNNALQELTALGISFLESREDLNRGLNENQSMNSPEKVFQTISVSVLKDNEKNEDKDEKNKSDSESDLEKNIEFGEMEVSDQENIEEPDTAEKSTLFSTFDNLYLKDYSQHDLQIIKEQETKSKLDTKPSTKLKNAKNRTTKITKNESDLSSMSSESSEVDDDVEYASESETLSETFSDTEIDSIPASNEDKGNFSGNFIKVKNEEYYCVYYDNSWYIGRVITRIDENTSKIKFLNLI